uniref:procollagen C-endopeptidase enhancer 2-like isoform X2 n=1 Tax=Myxine glutinosa TaxID=7769 RepID=UPI00358DDBD4
MGLPSRSDAIAIRQQFNIFLGGRGTGPGFKCGGVFTKMSGFFASEGFPSGYPPNRQCLWLVKAPPGNVVAITLKKLSIELSPGCRYDSVSLYDGPGLKAPLLGSYCGHSSPGTVVSTGPSLALQLISDDSDAGDGFLATFAVGPPTKLELGTCGGRLVSPRGSFITPKWPHSDYPRNLVCSWRMIAPVGKVVRLNFGKFDVSHGAACHFDHVAVYDGPSADEGTQIARACGYRPPGPFTSSGRKMLVQLVSDSSVAGFIGHGGDGFEAFYSTQPKHNAKVTATAQHEPMHKAVLQPSLAVGEDACKSNCGVTGTLADNYCSSDYVIVGTVSWVRRRGPGRAIDLRDIRLFKTGSLLVRRVGEAMSSTLQTACPACPHLESGGRYIFMGKVMAGGVGAIGPTSFVWPSEGHIFSRLENLFRQQKC